VNDPFLNNECLSLDLVPLAHARGYPATHVTFRGLQGATDRGLMSLVRAEGFVLVTNNARDFLALYRQEAVHPGLVVIVPGGIGAEAQTRLFGLVLDTIAPLSDLINRLVEAGSDGQIRVREWPGP
jgi:predicted nuclease of predicted toxin-antitoxin system